MSRYKKLVKERIVTYVSEKDLKELQELSTVWNESLSGALREILRGYLTNCSIMKRGL